MRAQPCAGARETLWSMQGKGEGGNPGSWMSSDSSLLFSPVHLSRCISILKEVWHSLFPLWAQDSRSGSTEVPLVACISLGCKSVPLTLKFFLPFHMCDEPFQFRVNLVREELDPKPEEADAYNVTHL